MQDNNEIMQLLSDSKSEFWTVLRAQFQFNIILLLHSLWSAACKYII